VALHAVGDAGFDFRFGEGRDGGAEEGAGVGGGLELVGHVCCRADPQAAGVPFQLGDIEECLRHVAAEVLPPAARAVAAHGQERVGQRRVGAPVRAGDTP
jgi:hypothetical protein